VIDVDDYAETVSVIIPTHDRAAMLTAAIDSVLRQSTPPNEIIVVSDLETSGTHSAVETARSRTDIPILYVENVDRPGASGSRNAGAEAAQGAVLAFLDDDDLWTPEHIARTLEVLRASESPMVIAGIEVFTETTSAPGIQLDAGVDAREAATRSHGVTGSNIVMRSDAFWSIGGFDPALRHLNDRDFFYRCMLAGLAYSTSPALTVRYRKHESGQLSGASVGRARGVHAYLVKHRRTLTFSDRRTLRYQMAVMRFRADRSAPGRLRWLVTAGLNASPRHQIARVKKARGVSARSGRAFTNDL
jgi:glycosyltransferase involved in cell wall biosynthesis